MRFKEWLLSRSIITDTPEGDFIADARVDEAFPDAMAWAPVRAHLESRHASTAAIEAGHVVWMRYRREYRQRYRKKESV